jgi:pyruvate,water dikinase
MTDALVLDFEAATSADACVLGGKCASLARMIHTGAPVPAGFAITTAAYQSMLATSKGLQADIDSALQGLSADDVRQQEQAAQRIAHAFAAQPLPAAVARAVTLAYLALCRAEGASDDLPVAVRSSATAEDLPDASFAGQQDTYLWVVGTDAVLTRVRDCWASLYTSRAIGYRNDRHIPHRDVHMAVGVQKMVDARVAGVAMTLDPLNGDRTRIVIDASWGLGESVVSGDVTPDHFVVDKVMRQIVARTISDKAVEVVADVHARCTARREVDESRRREPCLNDKQIEAVAAMSRQLERQFGAPQDVEWAIADHPAHPDGQLMLLQCRPETVWSQRRAAPDAIGSGVQGLVANLLKPVQIRV